MAIKKKGRYEKAANGHGWRGFVRCELDAEARERCKDAIAELSFDAVVEWMLLEIGDYKFSFSYDPEKDTATAAMSGTRFGNPDHDGYTLTAQARTVEAAGVVLMYKHREILNGNWNMEAQSTEREVDWMR